MICSDLLGCWAQPDRPVYPGSQYDLWPCLEAPPPKVGIEPVFPGPPSVEETESNKVFVFKLSFYAP